MNRWLSPLLLDPCHLPGWARHILPSALFGPCCLYLQYQRRRDQSLCLSLSQGLCLYRPEEEHVDRGVPEGFELDPPATSQLHQPASARGQAPKRPAPETPASTASEGPPSGPLSPAHPSQSSTRSSDPPLTAYSGPSRTAVGWSDMWSSRCWRGLSPTG